MKTRPASALTGFPSCPCLRYGLNSEKGVIEELYRGLFGELLRGILGDLTIAHLVVSDIILWLGRGASQYHRDFEEVWSYGEPCTSLKQSLL